MDQNNFEKWTELINSIGNFTNLSEKSGKEIYVKKLCNGNSLSEYMNKGSGKSEFFIDHIGKIFLAIFPKNTKFLTNLYCCQITMNQIYKKFVNDGIAIEGCFPIDKANLLPSLYQGKTVENNSISTNGQLIQDAAFFVVSNDNSLHIFDYDELANYTKNQINVQYVQGFKIFKNGHPFVDIDFMKKY